MKVIIMRELISKFFPARNDLKYHKKSELLAGLGVLLAAAMLVFMVLPGSFWFANCVTERMELRAFLFSGWEPTYWTFFLGCGLVLLGLWERKREKQLLLLRLPLSVLFGASMVLSHVGGKVALPVWLLAALAIVTPILGWCISLQERRRDGSGGRCGLQDGVSKEDKDES